MRGRRPQTFDSHAPLTRRVAPTSPHRGEEEQAEAPRRSNCASHARGWRAEKRKPMARALRHAGASRRAMSGDCGTGPRFPVRESRSSRPKAGSATPKSSASSWQGLLVVPGGAPMPPECRLCMSARGRRTSSRLTTPHENAPKRTRWMQFNGGVGGGDKIIPAPHARTVRTRYPSWSRDGWICG